MEAQATNARSGSNASAMIESGEDSAANAMIAKRANIAAGESNVADLAAATSSATGQVENATKH